MSIASTSNPSNMGSAMHRGVMILLGIVEVVLELLEDST